MTKIIVLCSCFSRSYLYYLDFFYTSLTTFIFNPRLLRQSGAVVQWCNGAMVVHLNLPLRLLAPVQATLLPITHYPLPFHFTVVHGYNFCIIWPKQKPAKVSFHGRSDEDGCWSALLADCRWLRFDTLFRFYLPFIYISNRHYSILFYSIVLLCFGRFGWNNIHRLIHVIHDYR